jgi:hypothetical protein
MLQSKNNLLCNILDAEHKRATSMRIIKKIPAITVVGAVALFPPNSQAINGLPWIWSNFCGHVPDGNAVRPVAFAVPAAPGTPATPCAAAPSGYHRLQQATGEGDVSVDLSMSVDPGGSSLCYVYKRACKGVGFVPGAVRYGLTRRG